VLQLDYRFRLLISVKQSTKHDTQSAVIYKLSEMGHNFCGRCHNIPRTSFTSSWSLLCVHTRCVITTGTPNFQGQNLVSMRFICTKKFQGQRVR